MAKRVTVHFKASFKNKPGALEVPRCSMWALRARFGELTEDKAAVNCTKCAKMLGVEAAPKAVSSTAGTCQCCFGSYETRQKAGAGQFKAVLHGYQRPGHGYIVGNCRGVGFVPYEVSCDQTTVWRDELVVFLENERRFLHKLQNNMVEELATSVDTGERLAGPYGERIRKTVWVKRGALEATNPFSSSRPMVPAFETLRVAKVRDTEMRIEAMKRDIAFLTSKIISWKPVPFPLTKAA